MIKGKNLKFTVKDIAEGYVAVNPLFLKPLDAETIKELSNELQKGQAEVRREKLVKGDMLAIRLRNAKLQRLHQAHMVLRNYARAKRINIM